MLFVRSLGPAFAVVLAGCAAIPELEFDDDAGDAAPSFTHPEADDAGMADEDDAPFDRDVDPVTDESDDASRAEDTSRTPRPPANDAAAPSVDAAPPSADASPPPTGCPWVTPPGASACCGIVPCVGKKCATHCLVCIGCLGGVCCLASNGKTAKCAATPGACPHAHK